MNELTLPIGSTKNLIEVMSLAAQNAERLKHPRLLTTHIALALLQHNNGSGKASIGLKSLTVQTDELVGQVSHYLNSPSEPESELSISDLLVAAHKQSRKQGLPYVGTEHLIVALSEANTPFAAMLRKRGIGAADVRHALCKMTGDNWLSPTTPKALIDSAVEQQLGKELPAEGAGFTAEVPIRNIPSFTIPLANRKIRISPRLLATLLVCAGKNNEIDDVILAHALGAPLQTA
ncbi:MAG: hypothetical protein HYV68_00550 [Candidatus Taylorbacteria bacterium]|nr:hypothetical protein [Candidatus Taylorbacteria bacterium]